MITSKEPVDWRDLQVMVADILTQCGFTVQIEPVLRTARGEIEVDVYATEEVKGRKYTIACECKRWHASIPQSVIHSFRSIVHDLGCNIGYIITTSNFQSGSIQNVDFTNIELLTWPQFQEKFIETWFERYFVPTITEKLDPLMSYTEPLLPRWYEGMTDEDKQGFYQLKDKYDAIAIIVMTSFSKYSRILSGNDKERIRLPLIERIDPASIPRINIPEEILNEVGYWEFLQKTIAFGEGGIAAFRRLRNKYVNYSDDE